jgi:putative salt-induced outer membrane protein YdiY
MAKKINKITTDEEGHPILQGELFWRWKAADNEVLNTELSLKLKQAEVDALLEKHPEVQAALNQRQYIITRSVQAQADRMKVYKDIETHLGISLKNVSIDDVSGRVHTHETTPTESPQAGSRRKKTKK